jgi:RNA 3'-terminal phosphate cyclase (ATP)
LAPEAVGEEAATQLIKGIDAGGCVDEVEQDINPPFQIDSLYFLQWTQDQIIIFMALAEGKSEVRCGTDGLSLHTRFVKNLDLHSIDEINQRFRTAIWLAEELTDAKFEVEHEANGSVIIRCEGIGYTAPHTSTLDESACENPGPTSFQEKEP